MNGWEKAKTIATILSTLAVPVVLAIAGYFFTAALKEREVQGKFVELAVAILKEPPQEQTRPLRTWATQVIDKYSGVPLTGPTQRLLQDSLSFPKDFGLLWRYEPFGGMSDLLPLLSNLGYYKPLIGFNKGTGVARLGEAIREVQRKHGLPVTGLADEATMEALRREFEQKQSPHRK